jgi:alcohol dehydrogenase class IV
MRADVDAGSGPTTSSTCASCASPAHEHPEVRLPHDHPLRRGAQTLVGPHLVDQGLKRPLVVTDRALAKLPVRSPFVDLLKTAGLDAAVFDGIYGNPTVSPGELPGAAAFRAHRADSVIGFGGGARSTSRRSSA